MRATQRLVVPCYFVEDTIKLVHNIAKESILGDVFLLTGPVGTGKSVFAREFLRFRCNDPKLLVMSPSYSILHKYEHNGIMYKHFDFYRVTPTDELSMLD